MLLTSSQVMRSETLRLQHEQSVMKEKIRDNGEKIKQNKVLPYLVGNVVEVNARNSIHRCQVLMENTSDFGCGSRG